MFAAAGPVSGQQWHRASLGVECASALWRARSPARSLRLASLAADPEAFASTYAEDAGEPAERWQWWAAQSEDGRTQRTFVLVADDGRWLGLTLVRLDGDKAWLGGAQCDVDRTRSQGPSCGAPVVRGVCEMGSRARLQ